MQLIPKSMLARTIWVLGIGFILMIADGIFVTVMLMHSNSNSSTYYELITRVKVITRLTSNTNALHRTALLNNLNDPLLDVSWNASKPDISKIHFDWATSKMNFHLMQFLKKLPIQHLVVGHPNSDTSNSSEHFILTIQLDDNSWLQFRGQAPHKHRAFFANIIGIFIVFIVSIFFIALLISRQIIKPLRSFSNAAISFSVDINAMPLAESGPIEIIHTARAFNTMQQRISHFVKERMQIIAAISHDLRTPLTRLRLRFDAMNNLPEYEKIIMDINDMQTMLDATLAFAKDDSKQEERTKINLTSLLQTICDDAIDAGGKIECDLQLGIEINCGPVALKRAVNNIVDNSLRYGGSALVTLRREMQQVIISVRDQGTGIPEDEQQKVLMPFYRIEKSRNKHTGGTGLGLTVAKTIISAHGGEISLENMEEGGLQVVITLPL